MEFIHFLGSHKLNNTNIVRAHTGTAGVGAECGCYFNQHLVLARPKHEIVGMERLEQSQERPQQHPGPAWVWVYPVPNLGLGTGGR